MKKTVFDFIGDLDSIAAPIPVCGRYARSDGAAGVGGDGAGTGDSGSGSGEAGGSGSDAGAGASADGQGGDGKGTSLADNKPPRTFTQEEVNRMMTTEKEQGRRAALAELGITDPAQAKTLLEMASKLVDAGKTPEDKVDDASSKAAKAEQRAEAAEQKLTLMAAKANPDTLDDVLVLVKARVNDKMDFAAATEAVKKQFPSLFDGSTGSGGTGTPPGSGQRGGAELGVHGKRAAAAAKAAKGKAESSFFKMT